VHGAPAAAAAPATRPRRPHRPRGSTPPQIAALRPRPLEEEDCGRDEWCGQGPAFEEYLEELRETLGPQDPGLHELECRHYAALAVEAAVAAVLAEAAVSEAGERAARHEAQAGSCGEGAGDGTDATSNGSLRLCLDGADGSSEADSPTASRAMQLPKLRCWPGSGSQPGGGSAEQLSLDGSSRPGSPGAALRASPLGGPRAAELLTSSNPLYDMPPGSSAAGSEYGHSERLVLGEGEGSEEAAAEGLLVLGPGLDLALGLCMGLDLPQQQGGGEGSLQSQHSQHSQQLSSKKLLLLGDDACRPGSAGSGGSGGSGGSAMLPAWWSSHGEAEAPPLELPEPPELQQEPQLQQPGAAADCAQLRTPARELVPAQAAAAAQGGGSGVAKQLSFDTAGKSSPRLAAVAAAEAAAAAADSSPIAHWVSTCATAAPAAAEAPEEDDGAAVAVHGCEPRQLRQALFSGGDDCTDVVIS
jgi:hypothetical protein